MSMRTNESYWRARAAMARTVSTHRRSSLSSPIRVSFTDTWPSARAPVIRWSSGGAGERARGAAPAGPERWDAEAEDDPDVAGARGAHHAVAGRPRGLVQHAVHEALQDLGEAGAAVGVDAEQLVHGGVHAPLLAAAVAVEPAPRLAPEAARLHERRHAGGRLQPLPERRAHHLAHLLRHVEPHLVEQRDGPDRKPEPHRRRVDLLDRGTLGEQVPDLVRVRGEDAVHPEPGAVLHDDHRLP